MRPRESPPIDLESVLRAIPENLSQVRAHVADAAVRSGRTAAEVTLVAVSKTWPPEVVQAAVDAGATALGENRVQEAQEKVPQVSGNPSWHLVGHLQRNKAKVAVDLFDTIQSVDSARLAREIGKHAAAAGKTVHALVQVNTSGEDSKSGTAPDAAAELVRLAGEVEGLQVEGLMTIATLTDDEAEIRRCFAQLRTLRDSIEAMDFPGVAMRHLSMGMTGDYAAAIEEGATIVRVGTGIFGRRG